jgi:hypothetical protein
MTKDEHFEAIVKAYDDFYHLSNPFDVMDKQAVVDDAVRSAWKAWKSEEFKMAEPAPFGPFPWDGMN